MDQIDSFDRMMGSLHNRPDVTSTKASTIRAVIPMLGLSQLFIVQTFRAKESGDTIFLEYVSQETTTRIAIPPEVADAISRQRDALSAKTRSKAAKATATARKERGELPGFMRNTAWKKQKRRIAKSLKE